MEGVGKDDLARGIGHYPQTQMPGQPGNFAIAGHRVTHGSPFRKLLELRKGDQVIVETADAVYTYELDGSPRDLTVKPTDNWVLDPVPGKPQETADQVDHHADHLPGPVPLPGPLSRLRAAGEGQQEVVNRP